MAVTAFMYGKAIQKAFNKEIDWDSDTIKVALVGSAYVPSQDTHEYFDVHVQANEASGLGYTAGGATLTGKAVNYDAATNAVRLDAADVTWPSSTVTARYAVVYDDTPATNKPVLGYVDFGANQSTSGTTFEIVWHANGVFEVAAA